LVRAGDVSEPVYGGELVGDITSEDVSGAAFRWLESGEGVAD
jgi:hypothetical protein